jgi:hypothetical protein
MGLLRVTTYVYKMIVVVFSAGRIEAPSVYPIITGEEMPPHPGPVWLSECSVQRQEVAHLVSPPLRRWVGTHL